MQAETRIASLQKRMARDAEKISNLRQITDQMADALRQIENFVSLDRHVNMPKTLMDLAISALVAYEAERKRSNG